MFYKTALLSPLVLALSIASISSPAAQTFSPRPNTFVLSGVLNLQQTININCEVHVTVSVDPSGFPTVLNRSFNPGNPACGSVINAFGPWTLSPNVGPPTTVTATIGATSFAGFCLGPVTGIWNNATQTLTFNNALMPGTPLSCTVDGTLTSNDPRVRIP